MSSSERASKRRDQSPVAKPPGGIVRRRRNDHLIKTRRQAVDDIHQLHEFLVLLRTHLGGNEEGEMPDLLAMQ